MVGRVAVSAFRGAVGTSGVDELENAGGVVDGVGSGIVDEGFDAVWDDSAVNGERLDAIGIFAECVPEGFPA